MMIKAPKITCSSAEVIVASTAVPKIAWNKIFRKIGSNKIKADPRKAPNIVPSPPMITMKRMRKDSSILKPVGSAVCR